MFRTLPALAGLALAVATSATFAAPVVDGRLDAAYGPAKASVAYAEGAPTSNFGAPGPTDNVVPYSLYSVDVGGFYYGFVKSSGNAQGNVFANLYFDIDPQNGNGSDIGIEVTNARAFVAGGTPGEYAGLDLANYGFRTMSFTDASGTGIEFVISNSFFTGPVAGLTYEDGQQFASPGGDVVLRLSQSFSYSVAGGATYGDDRLGRVALVGPAAVPEPSTMAVFGIGAVGLLLARRRRSKSA